MKLDKNKIKTTPRHIHFHEELLFKYLERILAKEKINFKEIYDKKNFLTFPNNCIKGYPENNKIYKIEITDEIDKIEKDKINVGIANLHVSEKNIDASYNPLKSPKLTFEKQADLFNLLNLATEKEKCDLLVLPELSVPYSWLPFMVNHARTSDVGLVFGLEHWVHNENVYNFLVTVLPFTTGKDKYKNCFISMRPKNHYSPRERMDLEILDLKPIKPDPSYYEIFKWRGVSFTVFNCFELTDIQHRALFRSEIDFMVAVEWNKDINYFANIIDSAVRDLHCYMIQVNTAKYGDSKIVAPKRTEQKQLVQISGGKNTVLLKTELDIKSLRNFQQKMFLAENKDYKPLPAGYERENVLKR